MLSSCFHGQNVCIYLITWWCLRNLNDSRPKNMSLLRWRGKFSTLSGLACVTVSMLGRISNVSWKNVKHGSLHGKACSWCNCTIEFPLTSAERWSEHEAGHYLESRESGRLSSSAQRQMLAAVCRSRSQRVLTADLGLHLTAGFF